MELTGASDLIGGLWNFINPHAGIGDFAFFRLISDYLDGEIATLTRKMLERTTLWAGMVALVLLTIWILTLGYQMVAGTYRGSATLIVTDMAKRVVIVTVAASMAMFGTDLNEFFTQDLDRAVNYLVTGEQDKTTAQSIDENLAYMQVAFSAIDAVNITDGNQQLQDEKARALLFSGFGTSSPAMTAGAMLMFFKFIMGFFVGLGPIFILCLMFERTKSMFQKWLQLGIATLFAMAALNLMASIVLELSSRIAVAFWGAKAINGIIGSDPEGMTMQSMQQGGIGLLLTVLLVTVPRVAGSFFGGLAESFMFASAFGGGGGMPGPQGQLPGTPGSYPASSAQPPSNTTVERPEKQASEGFGTQQNAGARTMANSGASQDDTVKKKT